MAGCEHGLHAVLFRDETVMNLCKECRNYLPRLDARWVSYLQSQGADAVSDDKCTHADATYTEPVRGIETYTPCAVMRSSTGRCGQAGTLWEAVEEQA